MNSIVRVVKRISFICDTAFTLIVLVGSGAIGWERGINWGKSKAKKMEQSSI